MMGFPTSIVINTIGANMHYCIYCHWCYTQHLVHLAPSKLSPLLQLIHHHYLHCCWYSPTSTANSIKGSSNLPQPQTLAHHHLYLQCSCHDPPLCCSLFITLFTAIDAAPFKQSSYSPPVVLGANTPNAISWPSSQWWGFEIWPAAAYMCMQVQMALVDRLYHPTWNQEWKSTCGGCRMLKK